MRRLLLPLLLCMAPVAAQAQSPTVLTGTITSNTTLSSGTTYLLRGYVKIDGGATLTIPAGTRILGEKASNGALIIMRGARIDAQGTAARPIVFTSQAAPGQRAPGDWGGLIILGRARLNTTGGTSSIEGIPTSENAIHGGTDDADNSGILRYVRIEFPGIALAPNNEINGLTMGSVGSGTQIDHVQVSYSGDDSFEWFGGTVNAKYLIAYRGTDDDFDTDNGFRGNLQFLYSLRDPALADFAAGGASNGFESDNDATGTFSQPQTSPVFSNVTLVGPKATPTTAIAGPYARALHLRRATFESVYNSVIVGWNTGLYIDGSRSANAATNDSLQFRNNIIAGAATAVAGTNAAGFDALGFFNRAGSSNRSFANNTDVLAASAFDLTTNNPVPAVRLRRRRGRASRTRGSRTPSSRPPPTSAPSTRRASAGTPPGRATTRRTIPIRWASLRKRLPGQA